MTDFRRVTDDLRDREPISRGREPKTELSRALLAGGTYFIVGPKKTWGSLYTLARSHGKIAHVKRAIVNTEEGSLIWFEDIEETND